MDQSLKRILKITLTTLLFIMVFFVLIVGKKFLYPLALAVLLSYLLYPAVSLLENKLKIPRLLAILLSIIIGLGLLFAFGEIFLIQIRVFIKDFPAIKEQALQNASYVQEFIASTFNFTVEEQQDWLKIQLANLLDSSNKFFSNIFKTMTGTIGRLVFIPIFAFFMLFYRDRAKLFILKISDKNKKFSEQLLEQISKVTIKYMTGVLTVVAILAVSHSIALSIIGVKYAIFLGIVAACISIIPYFGTLASTLVPLTFSLILTNNPYEPLWIIAYYLVANSVENNILTPTITGGNVNLNPLVTILGLILGAMIWGIPGMIIVIPVLGVIKIICDNVEGLEPYGFILGIDNKPKKFINKKKKNKKE